MLRNGHSQTKPGERNEPLWSPLMPEPEPWSPEKRLAMNSGTEALRKSVLQSIEAEGTLIEDKATDA